MNNAKSPKNLIYEIEFYKKWFYDEFDNFWQNNLSTMDFFIWTTEFASLGGLI